MPNANTPEFRNVELARFMNHETRAPCSSVAVGTATEHDEGGLNTILDGLRSLRRSHTPAILLFRPTKAIRGSSKIRRAGYLFKLLPLILARIFFFNEDELHHQRHEIYRDSRGEI